MNRTLVMSGWNIGFRKVEFTKMLQSELGLSLAQAKGTTDKVLDKQRVELNVSEEKYERVAMLATELGAVLTGKEKEALCQ
jgi:hypothetical protein